MKLRKVIIKQEVVQALSHHNSVFFQLLKWIKQNLKIKSFIGTSKNAVLTQIWIAVCVYLLLAIIKFQSKLQKSRQQLLRLLQLNLFEKRDRMALLRGDPMRNKPSAEYQMALF